MIIRFAMLLSAVGLISIGRLEAQSPRQVDSRRLDFGKLQSDEQICEWLKSVSPNFNGAYDAIAKRAGVTGIKFKSVSHEPTAFGELGVFFVDGTFEIRLSDQLTGAERMRTLAVELANAYLHDEHCQIDAGAAKGFFAAREYALAHEIYEYEAWRLYRQCLIEVETEIGEGNVPVGLFYGTPARRVADYKLPPLYEHLKHMEDSGHMQHYLNWFDKYYAKKPPPDK